MHGTQILEEARRLRREGMTCRQVAAALAHRISKSAVQRLAPGKRIKEAVRCPGCGAKIRPGECLACAAMNPPPSLPPGAEA